MCKYACLAFVCSVVLIPVCVLCVSVCLLVCVVGCLSVSAHVCVFASVPVCVCGLVCLDPNASLRALGDMPRVQRVLETVSGM